MGEVLDGLSTILDCHPIQLSFIIQDVEEQFKCTKMEILHPHLATPLHFMKEVHSVQWESLPRGTQGAIKILNEERVYGRIPHGTIAAYVNVMRNTSVMSPHMPHVMWLDYGAMTHLCRETTST